MRSSEDWIQDEGNEMWDAGSEIRLKQNPWQIRLSWMLTMTNIFQRMTKRQFERWVRIRSEGRPKYVLKRTLLYGGIIPALFIWGIFGWTTFPKLVMMLIVFSLPIDYAIARCSWVFQEYRFRNTNVPGLKSWATNI